MGSFQSRQFLGTHEEYRLQSKRWFSATPKRLTVQCRRGSSGSKDGKRRGDGRRPSRIGELIRREISPIIDNAFSRAFVRNEGQLKVFISVVDVKCSDDLRNARVSVSVLGTDQERQDALQWLRQARKDIRFELAHCIKMKYMPDLTFDESEMAKAVKTVNILNMLAKEREEKKETGVGDREREFDLASSASMKVSDQDLDLDISAEDAIITEALEEFDGLVDEDDDDDGVIIDVLDFDEDVEDMDDDRVKGMLFNAGADDGTRR